MSSSGVRLPTFLHGDHTNLMLKTSPIVDVIYSISPTAKLKNGGKKLSNTRVQTEQRLKRNTLTTYIQYMLFTSLYCFHTHTLLPNSFVDCLTFALVILTLTARIAGIALNRIA